MMYLRLHRVLVLTMVLVTLIPAGCRASSWDLWERYAEHFLTPEGRIIDPSRGSLTTSEGQAYALFFALVANDRTRFEQVLCWTNDNLAGGELDRRLPAWEWSKEKNGATGQPLDKNSAADADLWLAYTLIQAGRLWQQPRYTQLGNSMLSLIAKEEVANLPGFGPLLLAGHLGFHPSPNVWILNASYMPLPLLQAASVAQPDGPWKKMVEIFPTFLNQSASGGFAMDWTMYICEKGFAPWPGPGAKGNVQPVGSYDAVRVYLWEGMTNERTPGFISALHAFPGMQKYLSQHGLPPRSVGANGKVVSSDEMVGFDAAVIPYLYALDDNKIADAVRSRVDASKEKTTGLYGKEQQMYYDQNLIMFGTGWMDHIFRFDRSGNLELLWEKQ